MRGREGTLLRPSHWPIQAEGSGAAEPPANLRVLGRFPLQENFSMAEQNDFCINLFSKKIARQFETKPKTKTATKTKTKRVKTPTGRALRAPLAGSPAFVFVFVAVFVFGFVSN